MACTTRIRTKIFCSELTTLHRDLDMEQTDQRIFNIDVAGGHNNSMVRILLLGQSLCSNELVSLLSSTRQIYLFFSFFKVSVNSIVYLCSEIFLFCQHKLKFKFFTGIM
jgi:hypothetical protein